MPIPTLTTTMKSIGEAMSLGSVTVEALARWMLAGDDPRRVLDGTADGGIEEALDPQSQDPGRRPALTARTLRLA